MRQHRYAGGKKAYTCLSFRVNDIQTHLPVNCQKRLLANDFLPICYYLSYIYAYTLTEKLHTEGICPCIARHIPS